MLLPVRSLASHPVRWLLVVAVVVAAALVAGSRLELRADLLSMLPGEVPAARAYAAFLEDFGGLERIFVVVSPGAAVGGGGAAGGDPVLDAALRLEEELADDPLVRSVRAGIDPADERYLLEVLVPRSVLGDSSWTVERLAQRLTPDALRARALRLRDQVRNPVGELEVRLARTDPLGLATGRLLEGADGLGLEVDPLTGVFRSRSGSALLMVVPEVSELDSDAGRELAERLVERFAALEEALDGRVEIGAVGGPLYAAEDERLIRSDLERTITLSALGCLVVLVSAFGGWRAALVATAVVGSAFALCFGALGLLRGELLAVSLGFAAVLVGLGIDYTIHAVTRYRQGLEEGRSPEQALTELVRHSGTALAASALTTASAFAALTASDLRPLREVGLLVSVGIVAMLACTAFVGGPLLVLLVRARAVGPGARVAWLWRPAGMLPAWCVAFASRRPGVVVAVATAVLGLGLLGASGLRFEPSFEDLRPEDYWLEAAERRLVEEFGLGTDTATVLVRGADREEALRRSVAVTEALQERLGPAEGVELRVDSPARAFLPERARMARLEELSTLPWGEAADRLERELAAVGLAPGAFSAGLDAMRAFGRGEEPSVGAGLVAPDWVASQVAMEPDGATTVALRVRTDERGSRMLASAATARALAAAVEAGAPEAAGAPGARDDAVLVASAFALGEQMRLVGQREVGLLAVVSLGCVLLVVLLAVGLSPVRSVLALVPIGVGACVAFGVLGVTFGRLDFLSLAVLPMLFGIGIDDGLHALCGPRSRRAGLAGALDGTAARVQGAGRAISLTTITTVVGFGSLLSSNLPGLRHGGLVVAVGVVACWAATVFLLPALARIAGGADDEAATEAGVVAGGHGPETSSRWRRILGRLHFSGAVWYRLQAWTLRHVPEPVTRALMAPVVAVFFLLLGNVRRALVSNRRAVFGSRGWFGDRAAAFRALVQHAWCFSETWEGLDDPSRRAVSTVAGEENWWSLARRREEDGSPSGFIVVTAHIGHWEVGSHLSRFDEPRRIHVVREPEMTEEAQEFLEASFARDGDEHYVVHFARPEDPMLGGRLVSALRRGEIVALQGDRPRRGGRVVTTELFGRPLELPIGPFAMARAARVPLLPVFVFREGRRRSALHLRAPIDVERTSSRDRDLRLAAAAFTGELEWAIRRRPDQWFCLRRLWPGA